MIVVDASALTDFLLGRPEALGALERESHGNEHEPLHAPALIEPEVLNALRGMVRGGTISERRASEAIADLELVRLVRYPHGPLRARTWELRHALSAYDASYLALAEALGEQTTLVTSDAGLAGAARRALGGARVHHVP